MAWLSLELLLLVTVLISFGLLIGAADWRLLIAVLPVVGFAQDPLRKLTTGQPVILQMLVAGIFVLALVFAIRQHGTPTLRVVAGDDPKARLFFLWFIALVLAQSAHALTRFQSLMIPMIGALSYLLPFAGLWLAYVYARKLADIRRLLWVYVMVGAVTTATILISYAGFRSALFDPIGADAMVVYDLTVGIVELYCGLLRTPEIAAWHAGSVACFAVILATTFRGALFRLATPAIVIGCVYAAMLTGRRKVLAIMLLFACLYFAGLYVFTKGRGRSRVLVGTALGLLMTGAAVFMAPQLGEQSPHVTRSATVLEDASDRFVSLGLRSIQWGYYRGGFTGLGAGAGAQGTQHFGGLSTTGVGGAAEGGLGRIMVELGPIGLILAFACAYLAARQAKYSISQVADHPQLLRLSLGLIAFVSANVPVFIGASQVYGDPFVLVMLGLCLGFVYSMPRLLLLAQARWAQAELNRLSMVPSAPTDLDPSGAVKFR